MEPRDFIKEYEEYDVASCLYHGNCNSLLIDSVKNSTLAGMTFEGVVYKSNNVHKNNNNIDMFKIKSDAWFDNYPGENPSYELIPDTF